MAHISKKPKEPSFIQKGLKGFTFPLENKEVQVKFLDVEKGHDNFIISKKCTHIYYILEGSGYFTIEGERIDVSPGMLIEVPPNLEYAYSGTMRILLITHPPWFEGNEEITKKNPDV